MPELMARNVALSFLIHFAPPFGQFGDKVGCDGRVLELFRLGVAVNDDADEDGHEEDIQDEVE